MLQVKGLGSTIRDVLASGAARFGVPGSGASAARPADAERIAATQRTADGSTPFPPPRGDGSKSDPVRVDPNRVRVPLAEERGRTGESDTATARPSRRSSRRGPSDGETLAGLGTRGRETAFQAQRIAQEVIPDYPSPAVGDGANEADGGDGEPVRGITALARRVASNLYGFVRTAVGGAAREDRGAGSAQVLINDGYPGRVDLEV